MHRCKVYGAGRKHLCDNSRKTLALNRSSTTEGTIVQWVQLGLDFSQLVPLFGHPLHSEQAMQSYPAVFFKFQQFKSLNILPVFLTFLLYSYSDFYEVCWLHILIPTARQNQSSLLCLYFLMPLHLILLHLLFCIICMFT